MYALEDLGEAYKGFKFDSSISIGMGWIDEYEIGISHYVQAHLVLANTTLVTEKGLWCLKEVWIRAKNGLEVEFGFNASEHHVAEDYLKLEWKTLDVIHMRRLYSKLKSCIAHPDEEAMVGYSSYSSQKLKTFTWDLTLELIKKEKEKKRFYYPGEWKDTVVVSIVVDTSDSYPSNSEKIQEYQSAFEIILRAAKKFQMDLYSVTTLGNDHQKFQVQLVSIKSVDTTSSNDSQHLAIRLALNTFESLMEKGQNTQCAILIMSGIAYEGLLKAATRQQYRLLGNHLTLSVKLVLRIII